MSLPSCYQVKNSDVIFVLDGNFLIFLLRHIFVVDAHDDVPEGEQSLIQQTFYGHAGVPWVIFGIDFDHSFGSITSNNCGRSMPISLNLSGVGIPLLVQPRRR